eukprot:241787-Pelagomonas_calceolata.AAC.3
MSGAASQPGWTVAHLSGWMVAIRGAAPGGTLRHLGVERGAEGTPGTSYNKFTSFSAGAQLHSLQIDPVCSELLSVLHKLEPGRSCWSTGKALKRLTPELLCPEEKPRVLPGCFGQLDKIVVTRHPVRKAACVGMRELGNDRLGSNGPFSASVHGWLCSCVRVGQWRVGWITWVLLTKCAGLVVHLRVSRTTAGLMSWECPPPPASQMGTAQPMCRAGCAPV